MTLLWLQLQLWAVVLLCRAWWTYRRIWWWFDTRRAVREMLYGKRGGQVPVGILRADD